MKTKDLLYYRALAGDGGGSPSPGPTPGPTVEENDVMFYDYDGTPVASYSKDEFLALTEMPANPDRTAEGLVAHGWNWTLEDAKATVQDAGFLDIGQMYETASGDTEIDVTITQLTLEPFVGLAVNGSVTIDWGDGTTPSELAGTSTTEVVTTGHTYSVPGKYTVKIHSTGEYFILSTYSLKAAIFTNGLTDGNVTYQSCVTAIRMGLNAKVGGKAFYNLHNLEKISLNNNFSTISASMFYGCMELPFVVFSFSNLGSIGQSAFQNCYKLKKISMPPVHVAGVPSSFAFNCVSLKRFSFVLDGRLRSSSFSNCVNLENVTLDDDTTQIDTAVFTGCCKLEAVILKRATPPSIQSNQFADCSPNMKIYVPHGTLAAYQAASNWSTYASQMVEMPA